MSKPISEIIVELSNSSYHSRNYQEKIELSLMKAQLITVVQYLEKCYAIS